MLCPKSRVEKSVVMLENGDEVHGEEAVKEAYRQEFSNRLGPNEIDPRYKNYEKLTLYLLSLYINWARENCSDHDFTYEEVKKIIESLLNKKAAGLDGIFNEVLKAAGRSMIMALVAVLNLIKNELVTPEQWDQVQITTLFKNSGSRKLLVNFRGIFLSVCVSKLFEKLVKSRINDKLKNISKRQNGATEGKCPDDSIFLINACIDHAKYLNQSVTILFYDLKQCFDKLWLESCLISLWDIGVRNEWLPLLLSLNEQAHIVCKTPAGTTSPFTANRIVKQGTVMGSSFCGAQTAEYGSDVVGFQIGKVNVKPPVFVDDIAAIIQGTDKIVDAHQKAIIFSKRKRGAFGISKCVYLPINYKKYEAEPHLTIENQVMKKAHVAKCLGDQFNVKGNNQDLIEARCRKAFGKTVSLISMCEEAHLGKYFLHTLLLLYRSMFILTVLFNSEAWSHITTKNTDKLRTEQLRYLKRMMAVPRSASNSFIFLELGVLPVEYEIAQRQMIFLHHILNLSNDDPVKLVYNESRKFTHEKNWSNNIHVTLRDFNVLMSDDEIIMMPRKKWKRFVKGKVTEKAFSYLSREGGQGSKTSPLYYREFKRQDYICRLPPRTAQQVFRVRSRTVSCKANQKERYNNNLLCRSGCNVVEDQEHVVNCPVIHGNVNWISLDFLLDEFDVNDNVEKINIIARRVTKAYEYFHE